MIGFRGVALPIGLVLTMGIAGCGQPASKPGNAGGGGGGGGTNAAAQTVPTTPAEGGWVVLDIADDGLSVELPAAPTLEDPHKFKDAGDRDVSDLEKKYADKAAKTKTYRANAPKYSVGVIISPMIDPAQDAEAAAKEHGEFLAGQVPGSKHQIIEHAGIKGLDATMPGRGSVSAMLERTLYRNGKEILLQFNVNKGETEESTKADRERFYNSLKFKP